MLGPESSWVESTGGFYLSPVPFHSASIVNILHQCATFVAINEPSLTHQYHSKSTAYIKVHFWCCGFHEFWKMCHHYNATQNSFTALQLLCVLPTPPSFPLNPWRLLMFCGLHSLAFYRVSNSWTHTVYSIFQIGFFHLAMYIESSSCLCMAWQLTAFFHE